MRFLQKYSDHIARMAVVGADKWEKWWLCFSPEPLFFSSSGRDSLFRNFRDRSCLGLGQIEQEC
jgi:hypothetical protein